MSRWVSSHGELHRPFGSRYNHDGKALERDVADALHQILSGLPYVLKMNKKLVDRRGNAFKIDILVTDRNPNRRYAIIECKNIRSMNPITNESGLRKAANQLSFFKDDNALKICVVNKRRRLSDAAKKKIDHMYKFQIKGKIYDWSADFDWLKMGYSVRKAILGHWTLKEDMGMYTKLISYAENELGLPQRERRRFLTKLGIKYAIAHRVVWAYDMKKKGI
jgi:hypothetical protein